MEQEEEEGEKKRDEIKEQEPIFAGWDATRKRVGLVC